MKKINLLFAGNDFKFLYPIIDHYGHNEAYNVITFEYEGIKIPDVVALSNLLPDADIIFCEWGLENISWISKNKLPGQKLVVRIHRHEFTHPFFYDTVWSNVDKIIFISPFLLERFVRMFPDTSDRCRLIYNLIDCSSLDREKYEGSSFNLGLLGILPKLKAPHFAVEILRKLKRYDNRYRLIIKSKMPTELNWIWEKRVERKYYRKFFKEIQRSDVRDSVIIEPSGGDIAEWFNKIGFILSTSDFEGSHQAIAEGMASGSIPVIRDWDGSGLIYPQKYIYKKTKEAVNIIRELSVSGKVQEEGNFVKSYARSHFDLPIILPQYDEIFMTQ